jgi:uncharacterized protein (DUF1697 family)
MTTCTPHLEGRLYTTTQPLSSKYVGNIEKNVETIIKEKPWFETPQEIILDHAVSVLTEEKEDLLTRLAETQDVNEELLRETRLLHSINSSLYTYFQYRSSMNKK